MDKNQLIKMIITGMMELTNFKKGAIIMVDGVRIKTMRKRIGERAGRLCNNDQYLPLVRNRQNKVSEEEWEMICEVAEGADNPCHYFMRMLKCWERTLDVVKRKIERGKKLVGVVGHIVDKYIGDIKDNLDYRNWICYQMMNYSEYQMMEICRRSKNKKSPTRWVCGVLKKGFVL